MHKLLLDVIGCDLSPRSMLEGAQLALPELQGELLLVGDEAVIKPLVSKRRFRLLQEALHAADDSKTKCRVRIVHAPETIAMEDSIRAVRNKPGSSINLGCRLAAEDWRAWKESARAQGTSAIDDNSLPRPSAFISAGHSGAMMASALLQMGRIENVERPAIAVKLPTLSPDGCVRLDVGANVDCKPEHLRDFAVMGALFAQVERSSPSLPRVGVLSNGEERSKGNALTRAAVEQIEKLSCFCEGPHQVGRFVGNSEGKELFKGQVDVVVTDGFVGNLVLKSVEGLGSAVVTLLKREAKTNPFNTLGFLLASSAFRRLKRKLDYAEYGAAPLLGVAGYAFICHGRSNAKAIKNALLRTQTALRSQLVERLETALQSAIRP